MLTVLSVFSSPSCSVSLKTFFPCLLLIHVLSVQRVLWFTLLFTSCLYLPFSHILIFILLSMWRRARVALKLQCRGANTRQCKSERKSVHFLGWDQLFRHQSPNLVHFKVLNLLLVQLSSSTMHQSSCLIISSSYNPSVPLYNWSMQPLYPTITSLLSFFFSLQHIAL